MLLMMSLIIANAGRFDLFLQVNDHDRQYSLPHHQGSSKDRILQGIRAPTLYFHIIDNDGFLQPWLPVLSLWPLGRLPRPDLIRHLRPQIVAPRPQPLASWEVAPASLESSSSAQDSGSTSSTLPRPLGRLPPPAFVASIFTAPAGFCRVHLHGHRQPLLGKSFQYSKAVTK